MNLKEWRENAGLTKTQFASNVSDVCKRKATADHVTAWENGSMPGWDFGEAISKLTGGRVKADSFGRREKV